MTVKIPIDRDTKILLLNVLKKGYFDETDTQKLSKYGVFADESVKPLERIRQIYGISNETAE